MKLFQLTDGFAIKGYVQFPLYVQSEEGKILEFQMECYVVPGMGVPLLLGEDFHVNYEIGVLRRSEEGSLIQVGDSPHAVMDPP